MASLRKLAAAAFFSLGLYTAFASSNIAFPRDASVRVPFTRSSGLVLSDQGTGDISYSLNITLGGREFSVTLDTGSSDLYIYAPEGGIQITNDSHLEANITYVKGSVAGTVQFAELKIGEYTIPSQAFINVQTLGDDAPGSMGLLGVSFDSDLESEVDQTVHRAWGEDVTLGRTTMANLFAQNSSLQPSYDLLLNRVVDLEGGANGAFVVGYHDPAYAAVARAPQIPRVVDHQWAGYLDGMKVNGQDIPLPPSAIANTTEGKLVALFDSGTSDLVIPGDLADAIYGTINGSIKVNDTWFAPCYDSANISFTIGNLDYPLHPLDLSRAHAYSSALPDGTETTFFLCTSTVTDANTLALNNVDIILGDVFLKNVLTSFNFGPQNRESDQPGASGAFVQLLSLTDPEEAWLDFQLTQSFLFTHIAPTLIDPIFLPTLFPQDFSAVQNSTDTGAITPFPSPTSSGLPGAAATDVDEVSGSLADAALSPDGAGADSGVASLLDKYGPVVIGLLGANLAVITILCIIAIAACTRGVVRGGAKTRTISPSYAPVGFRDKQAADYDPEESAPIRGYSDQ
ncbi:acid protease [Phanerochaete sordida]|uniref:Acid protease n=1 Tax=Phanerochaete sordida TaxID=48140 RepID=A0A9P3GQZ0_9APHY|nr:acid protease [Phanerochaete sordida]